MAAGLFTACAFDSGGPAAGGDDAPDAATDLADAAPGQPDAVPGLPDAGQLGVDAAVSEVGVVHCPRRTGLVTMDAETGDWPSFPLEAFDMQSAAQRIFATAGYVNSASAHMRCLHDTTHIYFLFEVTDDSHVVDSAQLYDDDSIGLFLDANGDATGPYGADDHQIYIRPSDTASWEDLTSGMAIPPDGSILNTGVNGNYVLEFRVSKDSLGAQGAIGDSIGFDMIVTDEDMVAGKQSAIGVWFASGRPECATCCQSETAARPWCDTTMFGTLRFDP